MTVINTSPAIHLHAVLPGGLVSLAGLIGEIIVPWEVGQELAAGPAWLPHLGGFGGDAAGPRAHRDSRPLRW
jgi:hypothetical protein